MHGVLGRPHTVLSMRQRRDIRESAHGGKPWETPSSRCSASCGKHSLGISTWHLSMFPRKPRRTLLRKHLQV